MAKKEEERVDLKKFSVQDEVFVEVRIIYTSYCTVGVTHWCRRTVV